MKNKRSPENMQIIAGKYARRKLESPTGDNVRPPLTRFRKALFDTLMPFLPRGPFLDLFGGSGSFAIEALSRGAPEATVVELNHRTAQLIQSNAKNIGVEEPIEVLKGNALDWLPKLAERGESYAVISAAPPYHQGLEPKILDLMDELLRDYEILQPDGIFYLQYPKKDVFDLDREYMDLWKSKSYGKTTFSYFFLKEDEEA